MHSEQSENDQKTGVVRRQFLKTAAALAGAAVTSTPRLSAQSAGTIMAYIGAYTDRGKGVHMFTVDPNDGTLTPTKVLTGITSPSSLDLHPSLKVMYAGNEISNFTGPSTSGS